MNTPIVPSQSLAQLFDAAGYVVRRDGPDLDIWNRSDVGIVVTKEQSGFVVSEWERADNPLPRMRASRFDDVERYLVSAVGDVARAHRKYFMIVMPWKPGEEAPGFDVQDIGNYWYSLTRVAGGRADQEARLELEGEGYNQAVVFSHIADIPVDDLVASYLAPDGAPALQRFVTDIR